LDNFLREHLSDAPENRAWNVPDDAIFEKAMRSVADEKRKKRRGWILVPVLLMSILMVTEYLHTLQIQKLQGKITALENNMAKESPGADPLASSSSNTMDVKSSLPVAPSAGSLESNAPASQNNTTSSSQDLTNPNTISSPTSGSPSVGSASNATSLNNGLNKSRQAPSEAGSSKRSLRNKSTTPLNARPNALPLSPGAEPSLTLEAPESVPSEPGAQGPPASMQVYDTVIPDNSFAAGWVTDPITSLVLTGVEKEEVVILPPLVTPVVSTQNKPLPVYVMSYGLLLGVNQSWLTMKNITPAPDANLYNYDNSQPGFSMSGFVNKPFSRKFSLQG
jgi:hypothetical protein